MSFTRHIENGAAAQMGRCNSAARAAELQQEPLRVVSAVVRYTPKAVRVVILAKRVRLGYTQGASLPRHQK